jgi:hypothetical protein
MCDKRKLFTYCPQEVFLSLKGVSQSDFSGSLKQLQLYWVE